MFTSHVLTNLTLTTNLSSLSRLGVTIIVGGRGGGGGVPAATGLR